MPLCGWCGRLTSQAREYQNGKSVIRLCADCAQNGIGKMSAQLLHPGPPPDDDAIPGVPGWIKATAVVLLLAIFVPVAMTLLAWLSAP